MAVGGGCKLGGRAWGRQPLVEPHRVEGQGHMFVCRAVTSVQTEGKVCWVCLEVNSPGGPFPGLPPQ